MMIPNIKAQQSTKVNRIIKLQVKLSNPFSKKQREHPELSKVECKGAKYRKGTYEDLSKDMGHVTVVTST